MPMVETPSTRASLLIRLRDPRGERAWAEFVEIYEPLVLGLARRHGLRGADADDLAQEVFVAVASAIGRWELDPAHHGPSRPRPGTRTDREPPGQKLSTAARSSA
jgi:hypothetical protein